MTTITMTALPLKKLRRSKAPPAFFSTLAVVFPKTTANVFFAQP